MSFNTYEVGEAPTVTGTFTDNGTPIDPSVVKVTITKPDGTEATYIYGTDEEVIKTSTGVYYMVVDIDQAGTWYYRWWSTGNGQASDQNLFEVENLY